MVAQGAGAETTVKTYSNGAYWGCTLEPSMGGHRGRWSPGPPYFKINCLNQVVVAHSFDPSGTREARGRLIFVS